MVYRHSGYPGGLKTRDLRATCSAASRRRPSAAAVRGMLPKGPLGRQMLKKLKVYAGPDAPARRPAARSRSSSPHAKAR